MCPDNAIHMLYICYTYAIHIMLYICYTYAYYHMCPDNDNAIHVSTLCYTVCPRNAIPPNAILCVRELPHTGASSFRSPSHIETTYTRTHTHPTN
jgi:hypothetical protein